MGKFPRKVDSQGMCPECGCIIYDAWACYECGEVHDDKYYAQTCCD